MHAGCLHCTIIGREVGPAVRSPVVLNVVIPLRQVHCQRRGEGYDHVQIKQVGTGARKKPEPDLSLAARLRGLQQECLGLNLQFALGLRARRCRSTLLGETKLRTRRQASGVHSALLSVCCVYVSAELGEGSSGGGLATHTSPFPLPRS